jgi:hypothetical protein
MYSSLPPSSSSCSCSCSCSSFSSCSSLTLSPLFSLDLHLIVNFVTASTSFKSSESWTPICLPQFNDKGYLHSYVYYITADICLLLISSKAEHFYELSKKKNFIVQELSTSGALTAISTALERQHYSPGQPSLLSFSIYLSFFYSFSPSFSLSFLTPLCSGEVGVSGLLHFVYKQQSTHQLTRPAFEPPYQTKIERKRCDVSSSSSSFFTTY